MTTPNLGIYCEKILYFLFVLNEFFQEEVPSNKTGFKAKSWREFKIAVSSLVFRLADLLF
jgi:hypothetical protein